MGRRWLSGSVVALIAASCTGDGSNDDAAGTIDVASTTIDDRSSAVTTTAATPTTTEEAVVDASDEQTETPPPESATTAPPAVDDAPTGAPDLVDLASLPPLAGVTIRPGVEQVTLLDAEPGLEVRLTRIPAPGELDPDTGSVALDPVASGTVDAFGSLVFRELPVEGIYVLRTDDTLDGPFEVLARDDHPDPSFYAEQRLPAPGFGYIETRDGTTLSANVVLPGPIEDGPYPTVLEYSGYTPSDPDAAGFADLFSALGYAYVGVNMRGTGCSGGSFRFFEYTQSTDGYDVVEAVAAQPWALNNRAGMVGVSYPGINQLFVAQTRPPSLSAITPLSVLDDSYRSTLYPGGILNTGFAVEWTQDRVDDGMPAIGPDGRPTGEGQQWAADQIASGDEMCAANQAVRLQNPDLVEEIQATPFYVPETADELALRLFVDRIEVPTFLAGAWQDEQTGGRFPTMIDRFTGTDHLYVSLLNGLHTESISPAVFPRLVEFLDLYVAERTPSLDTTRVIAPILARDIYGTTEFELGPDRFAGMEYGEALAAFESEPPIQVLFEQGAADGVPPLTPVARYVEHFEEWPIAATEARTWFVGQNGALLDDVEADDARAEYLAVPDGVPATFWDGNSSDLWRTDVVWDWQEPAPGTVASFVTDPLQETLVMVGSGSADLWVNSNLGDTDLEVTLTELRPDGGEVMVQSGWLRGSHRALDDEASSELRPVHTHLEADAAPLPDPADPGATGNDAPFALARVEIFPFAHTFRAGSQIRLMVDAPGGNRAVWVFDTISNGERVQIGLGPTFPSQLVLPVIPGIEVPESYPGCSSLRGQPCR